MLPQSGPAMVFGLHFAPGLAARRKFYFTLIDNVT
jgi:hypothetical protein